MENAGKTVPEGKVEKMIQGKLKKRVFLFIDGPQRTYRLVHDPRSHLNVQALADFRLLD